MSDNKKLYSDSRWNDTSPPIVIGHVEFAEEERKKHKEIVDKINKKYGIEIDENCTCSF